MEGNNVYDFSSSIFEEENRVEFHGYASVFNTLDLQNDIIMNNAFKNLPESVPLLWQHDQTFPIGKITHISQDENGLYIEGFITKYTFTGKEAIHLIEEGILDSLSIGYFVRDFFEVNEVNYLTEIDLVEVSLVSIPANKNAKLSMKNILKDKIQTMIEALKN